MPRCTPVDLDFIDRAPLVAEADLEVRSSPAEIWHVLNDTERWPEWFDRMTKATVTSSRWDGPGCTRRVAIGPLKVHERLVVWEPERLWGFCAIEVAWTAYLFKSLLEVVEIDEQLTGTRLTYVGAFSPTVVSRPFADRIVRNMQRAWATSLARIDEHLGY